MGARTVFEVKDASGSIFLYSHWGGDSKIEDAADALAKAKPRWADTTYGMRIFISQIIGKEWDTETGYGICAKDTFEEQYEPLAIDFDTQLVYSGNQVFTFSEFVNSYASVEKFAEVIVNA